MSGGDEVTTPHDGPQTPGPDQPRRIPLGQWVWEASGICLEEVNAERALGLPPVADPAHAKPEEMPAAAKYGDGLVPILQRKREQLLQLGLPDDPIKGFVAQVAVHHFSETVAEFERSNAAAHAGDAAAFSRHWVAGRAHDQVADPLFSTLECDIC